MTDIADDLPDHFKDEIQAVNESLDRATEKADGGGGDGGGGSNATYSGDDDEIDLPDVCRLCDNERQEGSMVCEECAEDDVGKIEEERAQLSQRLAKEDGFAAVDNELMKFYTHIVWWGGDDPDLSKSPDMWRSSEDVPEFVETFIRAAVADDAFWQGRLKELPVGAGSAIQDLFEEKMTQPQGWSLGSIVDDLQDLYPNVDKDYFITLTRNEVAALANKAREEAYTEHEDSDEYEYYWSGPQDYDTTPLCSEAKEETNPRFGGEPIPLEELEDLMESLARKHDEGTLDRVDEWLPHFQCRHTFVRKVYF